MPHARPTRTRNSRPGIWRAPARSYWFQTIRRVKRRAIFVPVAPVTDAGLDVSVYNNVLFTRTGGETDGGSAITSRAWTVTSGPAEVGNTLSTAALLNWTPTTIGVYVLRYTATNIIGSGFDEATITVLSPMGIPLPRIHRRRLSWLVR